MTLEVVIVGNQLPQLPDEVWSIILEMKREAHVKRMELEAAAGGETLSGRSQGGGRKDFKNALCSSCCVIHLLAAGFTVIFVVCTTI